MTRTMKILLTVSVLLNVLLVGALGGYAFNAYQNRLEHNRSIHEGLSPEGLQFLDESFQRVRSEMKDNFKEARHLRKDMMDVMMAEEFDSERFDALAQEMMAMHTAMMQAKMETHKSLAEKLPASDRQQLARWLSKIGGSERSHRKKGIRSFSGQDKPDHSLRPKENTSP